MNGAREYYDLFAPVVQVGKLYFQTSSHARGKTFHIFMIPDGEKVLGSIYSHKNKVEVYGVISGNPGWTESYGWLHGGPWIDDFNKLVKERREAKNWRETKIKEESEFNKKKEQGRVKKLLDQY